GFKERFIGRQRTIHFPITNNDFTSHDTLLNSLLNFTLLALDGQFKDASLREHS
ncbi:MAG: hypothetical protein RIR23_619, partial [Pseudomonadota bacterium]